MIVACGQMEAGAIDQACNVWPRAARLVERAAAVRADMLVLPETTYPAYWLGSVERYMQADVERTSVVLERFSKLAALHALWLVAGFVEEDAGNLYNSAALFDRTGALAGVARKSFLWDCDHRWFTPGRALCVFDTEFGKLGILICADARVPEIPATLAAKGAEMLIQPTAWVNTSQDRRKHYNIQPEFLIRARAQEFGVSFACCSKSGREPPTLEYVGQSQIVTAAGETVARAPIDGDALISAEVTPAAPRLPEIDAAVAKRLLSDEPPYEAKEPGGKCVLCSDSDSRAAASALKDAGARVATLAAADMAGFAIARCHALDGKQVLIAECKVPDDTLLRARAAENRVFVIAVADSVREVIDPNGTVLWRTGHCTRSVELDLGQADIKQFTPETHIWRHREPACYDFGGDA
ncbi:MAG: carbon-nitrogen hydrolase family protein [Planctomycetota bacterium]